MPLMLKGLEQAASYDTSTSMPSVTVRKSYFRRPSARKNIASKFNLRFDTKAASFGLGSSFSGGSGTRKSFSAASWSIGAWDLNMIVPVLTSSLHDIMLDPDIACRPITESRHGVGIGVSYTDFHAHKHVSCPYLPCVVCAIILEPVFLRIFFFAL
jgi:hypothetical protein